MMPKVPFCPNNLDLLGNWVLQMGIVHHHMHILPEVASVQEEVNVAEALFEAEVEIIRGEIIILTVIGTQHNRPQLNWRTIRDSLRRLWTPASSDPRWESILCHPQGRLQLNIADKQEENPALDIVYNQEEALTLGTVDNKKIKLLKVIIINYN